MKGEQGQDLWQGPRDCVVHVSMSYCGTIPSSWVWCLHCVLFRCTVCCTALYCCTVVLYSAVPLFVVPHIASPFRFYCFVLYFSAMRYVSLFELLLVMAT